MPRAKGLCYSEMADGSVNGTCAVLEESERKTEEGMGCSLNLEETLTYIHGAPRIKGTAAPARMKRLCELLGNPQETFPCVHVAGTNGKGSTVSMLAAALTASGYRTGKFISPYVLDFRERIQVDEEMIPPKELCQIAEQVKAADEQMQQEGLWLTEFEIVTGCGLLYFARKHCDIVVLEVGLGGRFDATNVIPQPLCAVITKIALDHTALLGDTLEEIAFEKCGIIKGGDVVSYPEQADSALNVIREQCRLKGAILHLPQPEEFPQRAYSLTSCQVTCEGKEITIPLGGTHQIQNFRTAYETIRILRKKGYTIPTDRIQEGIEGIRFPARLEEVRREPRVLLDGAHNPDGMEALAQALAGVSVTVIFAAMKDKDYAAGVGRLLDGTRRFIACGMRDLPRAASPEEILEHCHIGEKGVAAKDFPTAWHLALDGLEEGETIVICGSLYLCAEARAYLCSEPAEEKDKADNS